MYFDGSIVIIRVIICLRLHECNEKLLLVHRRNSSTTVWLNWLIIFSPPPPKVSVFGYLFIFYLIVSLETYTRCQEVAATLHWWCGTEGIWSPIALTPRYRQGPAALQKCRFFVIYCPEYLAGIVDGYFYYKLISYLLKDCRCVVYHYKE